MRQVIFVCPLMGLESQLCHMPEIKKAPSTQKQSWQSWHHSKDSPGQKDLASVEFSFHSVHPCKSRAMPSQCSDAARATSRPLYSFIFLQPSRHTGPEGKPTKSCLYGKWPCHIAKVSWDTWNQHHIHPLLCQMPLTWQRPGTHSQTNWHEISLPCTFHRLSALVPSVCEKWLLLRVENDATVRVCSKLCGKIACAW